MRPLDRLTSIKVKLGVVIVAAVGVTAIVLAIGHQRGLPLLPLTLGAGALALVMVQLLAHGMTSPLREMARAARAMAAGDYDRRVRATSRDEVGELATAFNRMAAELAEVDRFRRDLVANAAHELRTPLSALQAMLENAVDGVEPARDETLTAMLSQVERLGRLVTQLLDLSRLEAGAVEFAPTEFDVADLLDEVVRSLPPPAGSVRLHVEVEPTALVAHGDPDRLQQVVTNLIENAVRHSPPDGLVSVTASGNGHGVTLVVADEGPGIAPHDADRVFERFYRADRSRTPGRGSGLGLAIARWIVDLHGGGIRVEAAMPTGSRFIVELPSRG